jgi:hypothetical protein
MSRSFFVDAIIERYTATIGVVLFSKSAFPNCQRDDKRQPIRESIAKADDSDRAFNFPI